MYDWYGFVGGGGINPTKWTPDAIKCYKSRFNCKNCFINKTYSSLSNRCYMKHSVMKLIKTFGLPDDLGKEISDELI